MKNWGTVETSGPSETFNLKPFPLSALPTRLARCRKGWYLLTFRSNVWTEKIYEQNRERLIAS